MTVVIRVQTTSAGEDYTEGLATGRTQAAVNEALAGDTTLTGGGADTTLTGGVLTQH